MAQDLFNQGGHGVGAIVRQAEHLIVSGEYAVALRRLGEARSIDPGNTYIHAIVERVEALQWMQRHESSKFAPSEPGVRYLSLSVGKEYTQGIRADDPQQSLTPGEIQSWIRRLTTVACQLYERGAFDSAFQSLMRAYMLDPTNPDVMACEQKLLPAWEALRKRNPVPKLESQPRGHDTPGAAASAALRLTGDPRMASGGVAQQPKQVATPSASEARMVALLRQREMERRAKERAMWQEASKPPKLLGKRLEESAPDSPDPRKAIPARHRNGFFSKLMQGRLFS